MIEPTIEDVGRRVVYTAWGKAEPGKISSLSHRWVFVLYDNSPTSPQATNRQDLHWENSECS